MPTPAVVKLVRGANQLSLSTAPLFVGPDFIPPSVQLIPILAAGTSSNRYGGSIKAGERGQDKTFSFTVIIRGCASVAQVRGQAAAVRNFLTQAGNVDNPLYLYFKDNSDTVADPLWGQAAYYYEIIQGDAALGAVYGTGGPNMRGYGSTLNVTLTIHPYALGVPQIVATATGGILPDQWGTVDGSERGLQVPEATTNKMDNPVFGHATWNNNWTATAGVIASQNTASNFCLPQTQNSALLNSTVGGQFTQNINVGDTLFYSISAYVMRPDGGAVTIADCRIYYGGTGPTTVYRNLGDGLWLLTGSANGVAAGTTTGLQIEFGRSVILCGYQIEQRGSVTPLCWGDLLGCAWTGTAHASTSTRTVASCRIPISGTVLRASQGSIVFTWIAALAGTNSSILGVLDARDGSHNSLRLLWDAANKLNWQNSAATAQSAAFTPNPGDVTVFHCTWGPVNGMVLYKNGVSFASAAYTPVALGAALFLGTPYTGGSNCDGVFSDLRTYSYELSAAEVVADWNNNNDVAGSTQDVALRVGAIPWEWSNAGDNVFSPGTGVVNTVQKYNWGVFGGIPGSAPAVTQLTLTPVNSLNASQDIWLSRIVFPYFYNPAKAFFSDQGGTADVATSIGDNFFAASVTNSPVATWATISLDNKFTDLIQGKEVYLFTRLKDAGSNLTLGIQIYVTNSNLPTVSDYSAIVTDGTMRLFKSVPFIILRTRRVFTANDTVLGNITLNAIVQRSVAGAANVSMDFFSIMPRPLTKINVPNLTLASSVLVKGYTAASVNSAAYTDVDPVMGDKFELEPGGYNIVQSLFGLLGGSYVVTSTITFTSVWVTPRYALL